MSLKVGGHLAPKNQDLDFSTPVEVTEPEKDLDITAQPEEVITPQEPVEQEQPDNVQTQPEVVTQPEAPSFSDEQAFDFLSERLGRQITSFDDLKEQEVPQFVNPLDDDEVTKQIYEFRKSTGRPVEDFFKLNKDFSKLNDLEVAKEFLAREYPTFTKEELNYELSKFKEDDLDSDDEALAKKVELKKIASKGRQILAQDAEKYGKPLDTQYYPEQVRQDLELARKIRENSKGQEEQAKDYANGIFNATKSLDKIKVRLSDDLEIDFRVDEKSRKEIPTLIDTMPHWKNEDGSWNHQKIVEDAIKIKHSNDIARLAYEQGVNAGKEMIVKETKNTNFQSTPAMQNSNNSKGIQIEGLDNYLGNTKGLKIRK